MNHHDNGREKLEHVIKVLQNLPSTSKTAEIAGIIYDALDDELIPEGSFGSLDIMNPSDPLLHYRESLEELINTFMNADHASNPNFTLGLEAVKSFETLMNEYPKSDTSLRLKGSLTDMFELWQNMLLTRVELDLEQPLDPLSIFVDTFTTFRRLLPKDKKDLTDPSYTLLRSIFKEMLLSSQLFEHDENIVAKLDSICKKYGFFSLKKLAQSLPPERAELILKKLNG